MNSGPGSAAGAGRPAVLPPSESSGGIELIEPLLCSYAIVALGVNNSDHVAKVA